VARDQNLGKKTRPMSTLRNAFVPNRKLSAMTYLRYLRDRQESVAAHAFYCWLLRGCPEGSPEQDWFRAEAELDQEFVSQIELGLPC
jgi:hypothetical protein